MTPVSIEYAGGAGSGNVLDLVCSGLPTKGNLLWLQCVVDLELTGSHHGCHSRIHQRLQTRTEKATTFGISVVRSQVDAGLPRH